MIYYNKEEKKMIAGAIVWIIIGMIISLGFWGLVGYAAIHFIQKFW